MTRILLHSLCVTGCPPTATGWQALTGDIIVDSKGSTRRRKAHIRIHVATTPKTVSPLRLQNLAWFSITALESMDAVEGTLSVLMLHSNCGKELIPCHRLFFIGQLIAQM